jgi:1-deoxy-D-xylulose-5-phosphate synthase
VRFAIDRAGLVGADGPTHAGSFDLAYLCTLPNMVVMAPSDEAELMHMVATSTAIDDLPSAVRYPRGEGIGIDMPEVGQVLPIGKGRVVREGTQVALLALGTRLQECLKAAETLEAQNISTTVADARFAKPLDMALIQQLLNHHELLITVEEGSVGGFGAHVLCYAAQQNLLGAHQQILPLYLPDRFIDHGVPYEMYDEAGLNAPQIVEAVKARIQPAAKQKKKA